MKKLVVLAMLAVLVFGTFSFVPLLTKADTTVSVESTSVFARGLITNWGTSQVFGFIGIRAGVKNDNGTTRQFAMVNAMWSSDVKFNRTESEDPSPTPLPPGNFSFSFYAARLVNTTQVAFNSSGFALVITGLWDVVNVTETFELGAERFCPINWTMTFTPLVTNATGELDVNATHFGGIIPFGGTFALTITGIDPLKGIIFCYWQRSFELEITDFDAKGKTDIHDLVRVAQSYGSMPGMPGYNENYDFNFNLRINIGDLSTVAQNIQP